MPQCFDLRFVDFALVWKRCPSAKMCDLFLLLWSRNGAPMLRCAIRCRCFGFEKPQCEEVSKWCPNAKMYELPVLRRTRCKICCRCFGFEVLPQCQEVRCVAVALTWKWCHSPRMHDLLLLVWFRSGAAMSRPRFFCGCFVLEVVPQ